MARCQRVQVGHIRAVSCKDLSRPGLTDLLQLSSVVNLILESTRAIPIDVLFRWHATLQPTCMGGCDLCAQRKCVMVRRRGRPVCTSEPFWNSRVHRVYGDSVRRPDGKMQKLLTSEANLPYH